MTIEEQLTQEIKNLAAWALPLYAQITGNPDSIQSFNGMFGGKNTMYRLQPMASYPSFDDYMEAWLDAVMHDYMVRYNTGSLQGSSAQRVVACIRDAQLVEFILLFLIRSYYRATGNIGSVGASVRAKISAINQMP